MKLIDIITAPWAVREDRYNSIRQIYQAHINGPKLNLADLEARILDFEGNDDEKYEVINGIAVVPVQGVLSKNPSAFVRVLYGASSMLTIRDRFTQALDDPKVKSILLHVDSPGGTVDGTQDLARDIFNARGQKPIIAFSDGMICSAAYWIAAAADRIIISGDTPEVGSIGVRMTHYDWSEQNKRIGLAVTEIYAGKYKTAGDPDHPLSREDEDYLQSQVDYLYSIFVNDVAEFRGVEVETVLSNMADARIFIGRQAIEAGLVDGVSTFDQVIANVTEPRTGTPGAGVQQHYTLEVQSMEFTLETLSAKAPELLKEIRQSEREKAEAEYKNGLDESAEAARKDGFKTGFEEGQKAGQEAEAARIRGVAENTLPGYEDLASSMMYDGKSTGADLATAIIAAQKAEGAQHLADAAAGGADPVDGGDSGEQAHVAQKKTGKAPENEEQAKKVYEASEKLQNEFGSFAAYWAYTRAITDGRARERR